MGLELGDVGASLIRAETAKHDQDKILALPDICISYALAVDRGEIKMRNLIAALGTPLVRRRDRSGRSRHEPQFT
jgi:hypothetical protein